jgi:hypothetical protein
VPCRGKVVGNQPGEARANILTLADPVRHLFPRRLAPSAIRPEIPVRADSLASALRQPAVTPTPIGQETPVPPRPQ